MMDSSCSYHVSKVQSIFSLLLNENYSIILLFCSVFLYSAFYSIPDHGPVLDHCVVALLIDHNISRYQV